MLFVIKTCNKDYSDAPDSGTNDYHYELFSAQGFSLYLTN